MKRYRAFVGFLVLCLTAEAVSVESGWVAADFQGNDMTLAYGPQMIIEGLSFYLSDENWHLVFPPRNADAHDLSTSGTVVTRKARRNPVAVTEEVYTIGPDGLRVDMTIQVLPNSGAHYAVCDLFLGKPVFANAQVKREGQETRVLAPAKWTTVDVSRVVLATASGDWTFTFTTDGPVKWVLRSVCDRAWGPDEKKTFTFLHQNGGVPAAGMTERLSIEARFVPKPDYLAQIDDRFNERAAAYLTALLARYGAPPPAAEIPAALAPRVAWLADKVCDASAICRAGPPSACSSGR